MIEDANNRKIRDHRGIRKLDGCGQVTFYNKKQQALHGRITFSTTLCREKNALKRKIRETLHFNFR